jgi:hypothetical protein
MEDEALCKIVTKLLRQAVWHWDRLTVSFVDESHEGMWLIQVTMNV